MFITKRFAVTDKDLKELDQWLNSLKTPGHGVKVVGQVLDPRKDSNFCSYLVVTVSIWKTGDNLTPVVPVRETIDEIPEEPTINVE